MTVRQICNYELKMRATTLATANGLLRASEFMYQQAATTFNMGWDEKAKDRRTQAQNLANMAKEHTASGERILREALASMRKMMKRGKK